MHGATTAGSAAATRGYGAVVFDLLTGLLDSWTLWNAVAGAEAAGRRWRAAYLARTYAAGAYRPYEGIVAEAAVEVGLAAGRADDLVRRWDELAAWPDVPETLAALAGRVPLAVVTNCSDALAARAVARADGGAGAFAVVVSAERAGAYKPSARTYGLALAELGVPAGRALFVAGSPYDLVGAAAVGMPVFWHNRVGLVAPPGAPPPVAAGRTLAALAPLALGGAPG